jgi:phage-related protein
MREYLNLYYDGEYSKDKGVIQASLDSGLYDELFMATRSIVETKVKGNSKPFLHGVEYEPLEFPLTLSFENGMSEDRVRETARWINQLTYKPLYFVENQFDSPTYIFYCMYHGDIRKLHNGIKEGVLNLQMRCKDAYVYSPVYLDDEIDLSTNPVGGTEIQFENKSDEILKPECWITKVGVGDVTITNNSNGGQIVQLTSLYDGEIAYIDSENEHLESDIPGRFLFNLHNNEWLNLVFGINSLKIEGQCKLQFRYSFKFLTSS